MPKRWLPWLIGESMKFLINFRQVRNNLKTFRNLQIPNRADCKSLRPASAPHCPATAALAAPSS